MRDYKNYKAPEEAVLTKTIIILICVAILAGWGYVGNQDYKECMKGNQSVALCGGGNSK